MVVRTRIRAIMVPLTLYVVSGAVSGYFLWTAKNGERGTVAKLEYKASIAQLRDTLADLQGQRAKWEHRVSLMRSESVDRDLAEEQARDKIGYVDSRDVEIFTGAIKH
ncbi:septum formation initiator family protein [Lichenihabitans sp. Uapishka_5]|uniref:FtsB family cell division protein n=1 Tax=Lichenihabitans sp. Uapishka_5 TaxID=3037302 RepID=UPI0029E81BCF|nr:septum formation initiator family protein [Lichenihabitans sp. Uapishka_5]MDX7953260.1 septum formation initiator family protein [Lichenihabitans sp. Uapishka_5]